MNEYIVYYPTSLAKYDTEYSTVSLRIVSLAPVPAEERREGDKWPLWRIKYEPDSKMPYISGIGLFLDRSSRISVPGGTTYRYRDFPRLAVKIANDELKRVLGAL